MKRKFLSSVKSKIGFITICSALMISLGATTAFAATQSAKRIKNNEFHVAAIKVKEGLSAGQQAKEDEDSIAKNLEDTIGTPESPVRTKDSEVPAGAIKVKEGLPAGQQLNK